MAVLTNFVQDLGLRLVFLWIGLVEINDGRSVLNVGQKLELTLEKNNIINDGRSVLNVGQKLKPRKEQHNQM